MKILLISYHYSLSDSTGSLRPRSMAKYLPQNGIHVAVLTYRAQRETVSFADNVIGVRDITRDSVLLPFFYIWRIWQRGLRALGIYRSALEYWRDGALRHADEIMGRVNPDAILASYPSVEALEIGLALSEKYGVPLISDFRDGMLFDSLEAAALRHDCIRHHYEKLESQVVAASKLILTVSEPISTYFRDRYAHTNVMTLHNGFDPEDIKPDMSVDISEDMINIVHTGRLGASRFGTSGTGRGVNALSTALRDLLASDPGIAQRFRLHFVGQITSAERNCLAPFVGQGIVKLWGHQSRAKALGFQRKADVLLLITAPDQASIATGKLFEYLAANKPILALTRGTEAARIVNETGAGLVIPPDAPEEISAAVTSFVLADRSKRHTRNEALISTFSRVEQMKRLAMRLKEV